MQLNIVTPTKKLLTDAACDEVIVPAFRGELGILPGHAPLISTLDTGVLKYKLAGEDEFNGALIGDSTVRSIMFQIRQAINYQDSTVCREAVEETRSVSHGLSVLSFVLCWWKGCE